MSAISSFCGDIGRELIIRYDGLRGQFDAATGGLCTSSCAATRGALQIAADRLRVYAD